MKRTLSLIAVCIILLTACSSCARKTSPAFTIKKESVTSIDFKKNSLSADDPTKTVTVQKSVTDKEDVEAVIAWVHSLKLEKHDPIEFPIETIRYMMVLNGVKDHQLIFLDNYVVFDSTAYLYTDKAQASEASEKYALLNYPESDTTLGFTN